MIAALESPDAAYSWIPRSARRITRISWNSINWQARSVRYRRASRTAMLMRRPSPPVTAPADSSLSPFLVSYLYLMAARATTLHGASRVRAGVRRGDWHARDCTVGPC